MCVSRSLIHANECRNMWFRSLADRRASAYGLGPAGYVCRPTGELSGGLRHVVCSGGCLDGCLGLR